MTMRQEQMLDEQGREIERLDAENRTLKAALAAARQEGLRFAADMACIEGQRETGDRIRRYADTLSATAGVPPEEEK